MLDEFLALGVVGLNSSNSNFISGDNVAFVQINNKIKEIERTLEKDSMSFVFLQFAFQLRNL